MSIIEEPVQDGVAEGGVTDEVVPVLDGELAGEDGTAPSVAVIQDLEEVVTTLAGERSEPPVVEDEEPGPGEPLEEGEAVVEGELGDVGHGGLLLEGLGHAREAELVEEVEGGLSEHGRQFSLSFKWLA